jgi:hypothetical protein
MMDMVTWNEYEIFLAGGAVFFVVGFVIALFKIFRDRP